MVWRDRAAKTAPSPKSGVSASTSTNATMLSIAMLHGTGTSPESASREVGTGLLTPSCKLQATQNQL